MFSVPSHVDIQLLSLRLNLPANSRSGATYDLTVPTGIYSPCGENTSNDTVYIPLTLVRSDNDTLSAIGNTIAMNQTGSYSVFRYGALGNVANGILLLLQF